MDTKKSSVDVTGSYNTSIESTSLREIVVTHGKAAGINAISSFDKALWDAGIANYNLIKLTSIIPKDSRIVVQKVERNSIEIGNKLYVILSERSETVYGKEAWAGLGWSQADDKSGFFVEYSGNDKKEVIDSIKESINFMKKYRNLEYSNTKYKVEGIRCEEKPVCALVCAIFNSETW